MNLLTAVRPDAIDARSRIAALAASASYEIAARDAAGFEAAREVLAEGTLVAVIWMPKDSDNDRIAMSARLANAGFRPIPHIAARGIESEKALDRLLGRLADEGGAERAFVIGGDCRRIGPFASGFEAIASGQFARHGFREIGLPGYPEGHPAIPDAVLARDMKAKLAHVRDAGMKPLLLTQFSFEAEPIVRWFRTLRIAEPDVPVRIGLAGPASVRTLLRYARICGVGASTRGLKAVGGSIARMLVETGPDRIIRALAETPDQIDSEPTALHFFPFGGLARSARWINALAKGEFEVSTHDSGLKIGGRGRRIYR